jgi:hypothetical protein
MTVPSRRLEPVVQRLRARIGTRNILDTTHARMSHAEGELLGGIRTYVSWVLVGFDVGPPLAASFATELDGSLRGLWPFGGLPFTAAWRSRSA